MNFDFQTENFLLTATQKNATKIVTNINFIMNAFLLVLSFMLKLLDFSRYHMFIYDYKMNRTSILISLHLISYSFHAIIWMWGHFLR